MRFFIYVKDSQTDKTIPCLHQLLSLGSFETSTPFLLCFASGIVPLQKRFGLISASSSTCPLCSRTFFYYANSMCICLHIWHRHCSNICFQLNPLFSLIHVKPLHFCVAQVPFVILSCLKFYFVASSTCILILLLQILLSMMALPVPLKKFTDSKQCQEFSCQ